MTGTLHPKFRLNRPILYLTALALVTEIIYLGAFLWPFPLLSHYSTDTDMAGITDHSRLGFGVFVAAFTALFILMILATVAATGLSRQCGRRTTLFAVLIPGLAFAVTLVFVYPVTAIDVFNYAAEGRVLVHYHANPIFVTPSHFPRDPIMRLAGGWASSGAPYGPLGILVNSWPSLLDGAGLLWNLLLLKATFALLVTTEALLVHSVLVRIKPEAAAAGAVLTAWNPLLLFEMSANGHDDIVMLALAGLGLLALIDDQHVTGLILVGISSLVKYATLPLLPLALIFTLSRSGPLKRRVIRAVLGLAGAVALAVVAYAPFWEGSKTLNRALTENSFGLQSFSSALTVAVPSLSSDVASDLGRALFALLYLYACYLASRRPADLIWGCCLATVGFLALAAGSVKIWYLSWAMVLGAMTSLGVGLLTSLIAFGATISAAFYAYVFIWLGGTASDFRTMNMVAYLLAFAPALLLAIPAASWERLPARLRAGRVSSRPERA